MKYCSTVTAGKWIPSRPPADPVASPATSEAVSQLSPSLAECLHAENLSILAGLGTSLDVRGAKGAAAPSLKDLWTEAEGAAGKTFESILGSVRYRPGPEGRNVEALLTQCHLSQKYEPKAEVAAFVERVEAAVVRRCSFVDADTSLPLHEAFLRKIARRPTRLPRAKLFTTNYDLCFEVAAAHIRFVVVDGFSHTMPQEFDGANFAFDLVRRDGARDAPDYIPNVFHLYKLHGSVDWDGVGGQRVVRHPSPPRPLLIYPRSTKFETSYEQPFFEMMSRLQLALREPNCTLVVVGFGFNDTHIAQPIISALRSNVGLRAVIVDPILEGSRHPVHQQFSELIQGGDSRLTLLAGTFKDFVEELPDLVAATDDERHRYRVASRP